jgi:hypothetical protein
VGFGGTFDAVAREVLWFGIRKMGVRENMFIYIYIHIYIHIKIQGLVCGADKTNCPAAHRESGRGEEGSGFTALTYY